MRHFTKLTPTGQGPVSPVTPGDTHGERGQSHPTLSFVEGRLHVERPQSVVRAWAAFPDPVLRCAGSQGRGGHSTPSWSPVHGRPQEGRDRDTRRLGRHSQVKRLWMAGLLLIPVPLVTQRTVIGNCSLSPSKQHSAKLLGFQTFLLGPEGSPLGLAGKCCPPEPASVLGPVPSGPWDMGTRPSPSPWEWNPLHRPPSLCMLGRGLRPTA